MNNKSDFDLDRFLLEPDLEELIKPLGDFSEELEFAILKRVMVNLKSTVGSGAFRVIAKFQSSKKYGEQQIQVVDCRDRTFQSVFAEIMKGFGFGNRTHDFNNALTFNMVNGMMYFLYEKNFRTLMVFKNFDAFRLQEMINAVTFLTKLAGKTAVVLHTTKENAMKLSNHRDSTIKNSFQATTIKGCEVRNLDIEELQKFCLDCGIVNGKVIKDLTDYQPELEVLLGAMDEIRTDLKKKLKP